MAKDLMRRKAWLPRRRVPAPKFASRAKNLDDLRDAVDDAATASFALWLSYLFALFYLLIAVGGVTHRDLLMENPIELPFLNVKLPLVGFFVIGPLLFLIVHAYVLLHFVLLASKVGAFRNELEHQITDSDTRASLRRQLPNNFIVQLLAGPSDVRAGIISWMLRLIAEISLVAAPVTLLLFFQLQFLPYHHDWVTWWHRFAVLCDLAILWILWPSITRGRISLLSWGSFWRVKIVSAVAASVAAFFLAFTIATVPGESLHETWPSVRFVPTKWPETKLDRAREGESKFKTELRSLITQARSMQFSSLHELLVGGEDDPIAQKPMSLWSNRLVVPYVDVIERAKFDSDEKSEDARATLSLRGRRLEGAVLSGADLRKVDFTGAQLQGVVFDRADLRGAKFQCMQKELLPTKEEPPMKEESFTTAEASAAKREPSTTGEASSTKREPSTTVGASSTKRESSMSEESSSTNEEPTKGESSLAKAKCADLQGASFDHAKLQGALLYGAQLQGASLHYARLQGAWLLDANLQGALLKRAQLQGASLSNAQLQGAELKEAYLHAAQLKGSQLQWASLDGTQLQGASLDSVNVDGARFFEAFVWRTHSKSVSGKSIMRQVRTGNIYLEFESSAPEVCRWSAGSFDALKESIKEIPKGERQADALKHIEILDPSKLSEDAIPGSWSERADRSSDEEHSRSRAEVLQAVGCDIKGAPYVIRRFIEGVETSQRDHSFVNNTQLAVAFLDEATCPASRALTKRDRARLEKIRDRSGSTPQPAAVSVRYCDEANEIIQVDFKASVRRD